MNTQTGYSRKTIVQSILVKAIGQKSELSSAEYYGGCTYKKVKYILDYDTYDLVRADCLELYLKFYKPERKEVKNA